MKKITYFIIFLTCCNHAIAQNVVQENTSRSTDFEAISQVISADSVAQHLNFLASDELMGRDTGSLGIEKAADYLSNRLKHYGVRPYFDTYRDNFDADGIKAYNIVGVVEGTDSKLKGEYIVLGAHYDHIGVIASKAGDSIANGANDDASGTSAVLALAQYFSEKRTKRSIIFSFFSAEEKGLLGSKHLAAQFKDKGINIKAMFNIEMIGVPMENKDFLGYLTGYENSNMARVFNEYCKKEVLGFLPQAKEYRLFTRSDNYPFYTTLGVPAQTVSTFDFTNFEHYHEVGDEVETLDVPFMTKLINNLIPGIRGMANASVNKIEWYE